MNEHTKYSFKPVNVGEILKITPGNYRVISKKYGIVYTRKTKTSFIGIHSDLEYNDVTHILTEDKNNLEKCESCLDLFDSDNIESNGEQDFCKNCYEFFKKEIFQTGIDNIVEYLEGRKLVKDFHMFSHSKWSGVTEKEFKELNPE